MPRHVDKSRVRSAEIEGSAKRVVGCVWVAQRDRPDGPDRLARLRQDWPELVDALDDLRTLIERDMPNVGPPR